MMQVIPPISYADFEKVLDVLPETQHVTVRIFCLDCEKYFGSEYSMADMIILNIESPTKAKLLGLVKDYFDRDISKQPRCRKIEEGEMIETEPKQTDIVTFEKATWCIGGNIGSNLRIELDRYRIKIFYSNAQSAIAAKEIFDKLYTIPSLGIELNKHEWRG